MSDSFEWEMAMILCDIMTMGMRKVSNATKLIFIFFNEVTSIDNSRWLGIHAYVLEKWKWMPILFTLEKVTTCVTIANLTQVLLHVLLSFGNVDKCLSSGLKVNVTWDWWRVYAYYCAQWSHHSYQTQCSFYACSLFCTLTCLWRFYLPNHWLTTLKSWLLKYIFTFFNLVKRFLNLKGSIFCWMWKHWKSFEMWRYVGCQCFFLSKCWQNTSPSSCKCRQINLHVM